VCGVNVYVVGYLTQTTDADAQGFFFDFATQDYSILNGLAATTWTDISVASILPSHPGYSLLGLYIALDSPATEVDVSFRAKDATGDGLTYETCRNDPGTHLVGLIPASDSGFQYRASSDASVDIYVEGFIFSCPLSEGDRFVYQGPTEILSVVGSWTTCLSCADDAKAVISAPCQSPGAVGLYECRASGASNEDISYRKNSCGCFSILTPLGADHAFEYWTDPVGDADGRSITVGTIVLLTHS
jgi:hypothetical protein